MEITAIPLSADAFAPYGQVLAASGIGLERKPYAARMHNGRPNAKPNMTYMRIAPDATLVQIGVLERHRHSNQTFVPLNGTRQLIVVCPSGAQGEPLVGRAVAFAAEGSQAINYDADVWHAPRMALCLPGEFVMFRFDDGSDLDTEIIELPTPLTVRVSPR